ncbi:MAG: SpoIIE family protein phosphatase [Spirochaetales bacterium]|nr:SpoIIE family protein phosphatase [Spirochaetales bacterium]
MKSLGIKLGILYLFLAIINISFFTILIHINQVDLIVKIKKYESIQFASDISSEIHEFVSTINQSLDQYPVVAALEKAVEEACLRILGKTDFILFNADKRVIFESNPGDFSFDENYVMEAQNAITKREFSNRLFTASFINDREIHFYVPLDILNIDPVILLFRLDVSDIHENLGIIYRIVTIFIVCIMIFHVLFGIILHRIVLSPINILSARSLDISQGDYSARVNLKRSDEFGNLTAAFNRMAQSIQEKIEYLDRMKTRLEIELHMASEVQKSIYPKLRKTKYFDIAIHHRPLIEVSGDYHDIFSIGNDRYGFIIADVCGHGVSAALITMLIKEKCEEIAGTCTDTREFLKQINHVFGDMVSTYDKFFSAFYMIFDGKASSISYTSAGHMSAFAVREDKIIKLNTQGFMIGFSKNFSESFESKSMDLADNDKICIMTDGIYEVLNAERDQYGYRRLIDLSLKTAMLPADEMLKVILSDTSAFRGDCERNDDETMIIIDVKKREERGQAG